MVAMVIDRARAVAIITTITRGLRLELRQGLWQWSWLGITTTITRRALAIIITITRGLWLGLRQGWNQAPTKEFRKNVFFPTLISWGLTGFKPTI